jgi:TPR repeat protein
MLRCVIFSAFLCSLCLAEASPDADEVARLRAKAEAGDMQAQLLLGVHLSQGRGVSADPAAAIIWYKRSADAGSRTAQWYLGNAYEKGEGVAKDNEEAAKWYTLAAEWDDDARLLYIARFFRDGRPGFPGNPMTSTRWFQKASALGNSSATYELAGLLKSGLAGPNGATEAARLYGKAAGQGCSLSPGILADMYERGDGVPKNLPEARKWYRKAAEVSVFRGPAEQGFADKQYLVGELYYIHR